MLTMEEALKQCEADCDFCRGTCSRLDEQPDCKHCWHKAAQEAIGYRIKREIFKDSKQGVYRCINGHNIPRNIRQKLPFCPFCGQKLNWKKYIE